jgi:hypothetical protein
MTSDRALWSVCRACARLFVAWWRCDRVRVSPHEGELLRLRPACLLAIDSRCVQVLDRRVVNTPEGIALRYECQTADERAQLEVWRCRSTGKIEVHWQTSAGIRRLHEHQIDVLG